MSRYVALRTTSTATGFSLKFVGTRETLAEIRKYISNLRDSKTVRIYKSVD